MNTHSRTRQPGLRLSLLASMAGALLGASLILGVAPARAAETQTNAAPAETPSPMTPEEFFEGGTNAYNNWVEVAVGGFMTRGNAAAAQQRFNARTGAFGGIQDLHFQDTVATNTTLTIDARALADLNDYKLSLDLKRENLGFVRFNYENFRTWDNAAGGYYPPTGVQYRHFDDDLALDRGEISFEAGLRLEKVPQITFKYAHRYRDGDKASTIWGPVHPDPVNSPAGVRALAPSFYDIDEAADIFQLDATHKIKSTELGVGLRYESGNLDNALKTTPWQGESVQQRVTDRQGTSYDLLSVHAFSETWIKKNLFFSSGFLFANLDNDFTGSRIYGNDFDVGYVPNSLNGLGDFNLNGGSHKQEYVLNLNLMATPLTNFSIVPSIRVQKEDWDADSMGVGTLGDATGPFRSASSRDALDVRERLDLRHTGLSNWVFYGGGEWTQGDGNLTENGGLSQIDNIGVPPIRRETDDSRFFQKYFLGARWYPARRLTLDAGGYFKRNDYDYEHVFDSTRNTADSRDRYPAYLVMHGFDTYDANLRVTLRPVKNVTLVSRYEYQVSTVSTTPDSASGLGEMESSDMNSHILAQNVSWSPWSRLSLQAGFNYVLSGTKTPVTDVTHAILESQNNYWTLNFTAGFVLDDKTDLNLGYFFYQADDYHDNSSVGVPYGVGAEEHGFTATLTRRITPRIRLNLKYGYYHALDETSGWNNNYEAHVLYSSLQYRF